MLCIHFRIFKVFKLLGQNTHQCRVRWGRPATRHRPVHQWAGAAQAGMRRPMYFCLQQMYDIGRLMMNFLIANCSGFQKQQRVHEPCEDKVLKIFILFSYFYIYKQQLDHLCHINLCWRVIRMWCVKTYRHVFRSKECLPCGFYPRLGSYCGRGITSSGTVCDCHRYARGLRIAGVFFVLFKPDSELCLYAVFFPTCFSTEAPINDHTFSRKDIGRAFIQRRRHLKGLNRCDRFPLCFEKSKISISYF